MHRISTRHYIGTPNEPINLTASTPTSGALMVRFQGSTVGGLPKTVRFPASPGNSTMEASLNGPSGSQCALSVADVDGGTDISVLSVGAGIDHDVVTFTFVTVAPSVMGFRASFANVRT
jgi:hypothetical protein